MLCSVVRAGARLPSAFSTLKRDLGLGCLHHQVSQQGMGVPAQGRRGPCCLSPLLVAVPHPALRV